MHENLREDLFFGSSNGNESGREKAKKNNFKFRVKIVG